MRSKRERYEREEERYAQHELEENTDEHAYEAGVGLESTQDEDEGHAEGRKEKNEGELDASNFSSMGSDEWLVDRTHIIHERR